MKTPILNLGSDTGFKVDLMLLADSTGSMGVAMSNVKANFINAYQQFTSSTRWNCAVGVAYYKDVTDPNPFTVLQKITKDQGALAAAIKQLQPSGGGDTPEGQLYALTQLATNSISGWRPGATRVIAWFGDEPGHDPSKGCTLGSTIDVLLDRNVYVCAFSVAPSNNLDQSGQATAITNQTNGVTNGEYVMYNVQQSGVIQFIFNFLRQHTPG